MAGGGAILVLDLPQESVLSLDGKSLFLKRHDFMGFNNISSNAFHLFTFRAPASQCTQGIVLFCSSDDSDPIVIRRYNPQSEGLEDNVDELTKQNLRLSLERNQIEPQRVVSLAQQLHSTEEAQKWSLLTQSIQLQDLQRHGMRHGSMIWPSMDDSSFGKNNVNIDKNNIGPQQCVSFKFPPIPILGATSSHHSSRHEGTKRFLSTLTPSERTALYRADSPANGTLRQVLASYNAQNLLSDWQVAFLMLTHLHCYDSFVHWRDVLCLLSLDVSVECMEHYSDTLYVKFCTQLRHQLPFMDLEEDENDDNILHRSLKSLAKTLQQSTKLQDHGADLERLMSCLPFWVGACASSSSEDGASDDDGDDDDGPTIVNVEDFEASMNRAASYSKSVAADKRHAPKYPLLFAAIQPHEDVVMTCSRILDQQQDVGLVREAAAYLEEVEAVRE